MEIFLNAISFNDWLGPLMVIGAVKGALLAWVALEIAKHKAAAKDSEPAPSMPASTSAE